ncbi:lamin tail domain-containing protein [Sorangium cellulosum]|uniref:lamin tail domain-containing protein n=1 Tax=Sorangium cellulosum TaxID=56 RepID=UPI000410143B|nr:lamin tail domain-containing protein [Sorangium cellulosum]
MTQHPPTRPSCTPRARRALPLALAPLAASALSCAPELAAPPRSPPPDEEDAELADPADAGPELHIEPEAPLHAAPPVLRLRVRLPGASPEGVDPARALVVRGKVGAAHLRQIEQGELSKALSERVIPSIAWLDGMPPGDLTLTVAPLVPLAPGETYAVASGSPVFSHHLQIAAEGSPPVLPRIWPPPDAGASLGLGVWCGDAPLPETAAAATLEPSGPAGELRRGAVEGIGARCLRFEGEPPPAPGDADELRLVGPPIAFDGEPGAVSLDPRPFALESEPLSAVAAACAPDEVPLGPGCAQVADDRIRVRSADAPLLWAIAGEGLDEVLALRPGEPFVLGPLPPLAPVELALATVDNAGRVERRTFSAMTREPMPHVIINEVLANPVGPEPGQEWVELYNDGDVPADLTGYVLADVGGETELPSISLAPGAYALVVNEGFVSDDELDPPAPPEALLLRVPKLGNHGLSNSGEPLKLMDGGGAVLSRSPAMPEPKAGMSLARVGPRAPDGSAGSFVTSWPTPGRVNIMNQEIP